MSESYEYHFKAEEGENPTPTVTPEPPKKKGSAGRIIALALVCALLGGAIGAVASIRQNTHKRRRR